MAVNLVGKFKILLLIVVLLKVSFIEAKQPISEVNLDYYHQLCRLGNIQGMERFLKFNPELKLSKNKDSYGRTCLHRAASHNNNIEMIEWILKKNKSLLYMRSTTLRTAFSEASFFGHTEVLKVMALFDTGNKLPKIQDDLGRTPLIKAFRNLKFSTVEYLLNLNSSTEVLNLRDNEGNSFLDYVIFSKEDNILRKVFKLNSEPDFLRDVDSEGSTVFATAIDFGLISVVRMFLELGFSLDKVYYKHQYVKAIDILNQKPPNDVQLMPNIVSKRSTLQNLILTGEIFEIEEETSW